MTSRAARVWPGLILLAASLALLGPALRPGWTLIPALLPYAVDPLWQPLAPAHAAADANIVLNDVFYQYYPWAAALRQSLARGELPLWNPSIAGGHPLAANGMLGLFNPFHLLTLPLPLPVAFTVGALLRLWVAGLCTYGYARAVGLSRSASTLAMLTYALGGPMVAWLNYPLSHVFAWFPALIWTGEKLLAAPRMGWMLLAAVTLALTLFSSQPEVAFQMGLVWLVYLGVRGSWRAGGPMAGLRRYALPVMAAGLLGVGLAAVEVIPFLDALRSSAILADRGNPGLMPPSGWLRAILLEWRTWPTLITALLPHLLGTARGNTYWYPAGNPIENAFYLGVLPLALALIGLAAAFRRRLDGAARRWVLTWAGIGGGALALALHFPLVNGINLLPPFHLLAPGRLRIVVVLAVGLVAGFGLDWLRARPDLGRRPLAWLLGLFALINVVAAGAGYAGFTLLRDRLIASGRAFMEANAGRPSFAQPLPELYAQVEASYQAKVALFLPTNPVMYLPLWMAAAVLLLLWASTRRPRVASWLVPALVVLTAVDLVWAGFGHNTAAPAALLNPVPPAVTYLQAQPPGRIAATNLILNPNHAIIYGLEDVRGYEPMIAHRYRGLLGGISGFVPEHHHLFFSHLDDPRLDRLGAAYGLSLTPPTDPRWERVFADPSGVGVYHSRTALPRALVVYAAEIAATPEDARTRTLAPDFDPRQGVVLEETPSNWSPPAMPPAAPAGIEILARTPNRVTLTVESDAPGLLLLLDTYAPGWRATVNGTPAPIYAANYAFRVVVIPAGSSTVVFTYAPAAWPVGGAISVAAALVMVGIGVWPRPRSRP